MTQEFGRYRADYFIYSEHSRKLDHESLAGCKNNSANEKCGERKGIGLHLGRRSCKVVHGSRVCEGVQRTAVRNDADKATMPSNKPNQRRRATFTTNDDDGDISTIHNHQQYASENERLHERPYLVRLCRMPLVFEG